MKKEKILIIDEEQLLYKTVESILIKLGYRNNYFLNNLTEVRTVLKTLQFDLIICKISVLWKASKKLQLDQILKSVTTKVVYLIPSKMDGLFQEDQLPNSYTFIVWPINNLNFRAVIEIYFQEQLSFKQKEYLVLQRGGEEYNLRYKEILWIGAEGNYCYLYTKDQRIIKRSTIKSILEILPTDLFIQIHRSNIIQLSKIDHINTKSKTVQIGDYTILIGRKYRKDLFERLNII